MQETFKPEDHPNLLVGLTKADDAAVYRLNDQQAIITTTDFFPPVVDNPYDYGAIAAANAMSDIYAMGGKVLFAINLVAWPDNIDRDILREVLRGGAEKVAEAGGVIAGGHSVNDKEPKYGLAVTGVIDPAQVKAKGGAQPGDVLLLTKPLGTGVITTALKQGITKDADVETAVSGLGRWIGFTTMLLGGTFLLDQIDIINLNSIFGSFHWWGLFVLMPAVGSFVEALKLRRMGSYPVMETLLWLSGLFVGGTAVKELTGTSWHDSDQLIGIWLVAAGIILLLTSRRR